MNISSFSDPGLYDVSFTKVMLLLYVCRSQGNVLRMALFKNTPDDTLLISAILVLQIQVADLLGLGRPHPFNTLGCGFYLLES